MKKYLVIGNPIEHSLSPILHNYWIKENEINAIYEKKKLEEHELDDLILNIKNKKIDGINITVPFKKKIIPYLDKLSDEASNTQSVNTVYLDKGKIIGHNTDIIGFEIGLKKTNYNIKDKKILILGAGGVVSSIIYAVKKMKASEIIVSNRTQSKAEDLKNSYRKKLINKTVNVLFENKMKSGNRYFGRDEHFNSVIVESDDNLAGKIKNVKIINGNQNTLYGEIILNLSQTNCAA